MRRMLRRAAGLHDGGAIISDLKMWMETGPSNNPTFREIRLDWGVKMWSELGLKHGDIIVV